MQISILGTGLISSIGNTIDESFQSLLNKQSSFKPITRFPSADFAQTSGGVISEEIEESLRERYEGDLALAFIKEAVAEAIGSRELPEDTGLLLASNFALLETKEWCWRERLDVDEIDTETFDSQQYFIRNLQNDLKLKGPLAHLSLSCASGAAAVSLAREWLLAKRCTNVIVVCFDVLTEYCWCGLSNLRTITTDTIRPFDINRTGTIFSEGAAAILLSSEEGTDAYAYLASAATNNNAFHLTAPLKEAEGSRRVMAAALNEIELSDADVELICAHATGTTANDLTESVAINNLLKHRKVPVLALKSTLGHMLGAAGLAEIVMTIEAMKASQLPQLNSLQEHDPACDINYVGDENKSTSCSIAVTNSAGLGGNNAASVLSLNPIEQNLSMDTQVGLVNMAWVLSGEIGQGKELPKCPESNDELADFSVKPYINTVKGYLDPSGAFALAAASLALNGAELSNPSRTAIISATQFGASKSAYEFYDQMIGKGHRYASPMIFPHGYSNTAANLVAIEHGFSGPHYVFDTMESIEEAWWTAQQMIKRNLADDCLFIVYEAADPRALPDSYSVTNGALCFHLSQNGGELPELTSTSNNAGLIASILN